MREEFKQENSVMRQYEFSTEDFKEGLLRKRLARTFAILLRIQAATIQEPQVVTECQEERGEYKVGQKPEEAPAVEYKQVGLW